MAKAKTEKKPVGRPRSFESPEEMQGMIDEYFKRCKKEGEPLTVAGLAAGLNCHRDTLHEYSKQKGYSDLIKEAKQKIESSMCARMLNGDYNSTAAIFLLKCHYGYDDKAKDVAQMQNQINMLMQHQGMIRDMITNPAEVRTECDLDD